jgi:L-malate glycosyltransferase
MNILHTVEFYKPSVGGAQEVVKQLSERLVKLGHEVTVATSALPERKLNKINGVKIKEFKIKGNMVRGYVGNVEEYQDFLLKTDFEVMMNYAAQQWTMDLALPILEKITAKKVVVPCGFSGLSDPEYAEYFSKMPGWMKQYDNVIMMSDAYQDAKFANNHKISYTVIPNGAGKDEFEKTYNGDVRKELGIPQKDFLLLTVGSHTGLKGHLESIEAFKRAQINNATLVIIGNKTRKGCEKDCEKEALYAKLNLSLRRQKKKIIVRELDRDKTVALFKAADLFVFLSKIECSPLVIFEAAASSLPFIATDVGNVREITEWTKGGLITTFEDAHLGIEKLFSNIDTRNELGQNGYLNWKKRFTWEKITREYEKLYQSLT